MHSATSDASGNFLFTNPPTGSQVLLIDGPSALYPADMPVQMTIQPGVANVVPYQVYLHEVSQNYFPITPGAQTVISPPGDPGPDHDHSRRDDVPSACPRWWGTDDGGSFSMTRKKKGVRSCNHTCRNSRRTL